MFALSLRLPLIVAAEKMRQNKYCAVVMVATIKVQQKNRTDYLLDSRCIAPAPLLIFLTTFLR